MAEGFHRVLYIHTIILICSKFVAFFVAGVEISEVVISGTPMPEFGKCSFYLIFVFLSCLSNYC